MPNTSQRRSLSREKLPVRNSGLDGSCTASRHGTRAAVLNHRCTCPDARERARRYDRYYKVDRTRGQHRLQPAAGTARRLQALTAVGYGIRELSAELDSGTWAVRKLRSGQQAHVQRTTAARIAGLFDRLSARPRQGPMAEHAVAHARENGWAPPLAWDETTIDDPTAKPWQWCTGSAQPVAHLQDPPIVDSKDIDPVVVDRLIHGQHTPATRAEKHAAALHLLERGHSCADVATRIGIAERTAQRLRSRLDVGPREDAADDTHHDREVAS